MKKWLLLWLAGGTLCQAMAQRDGTLPKDTLATVGTSVITARDFLERFELMPWPGKDRRQDHDSAKVRALRSLVAERLLAQEAAVRGIGRDSLARRRVSGLEQVMVRDELFKREVVARVQITDKEMSVGMKRYPRELRLLYLRSPSRETALALRDSVGRKGVLDSLLHRISRRLLTRVDTLTLAYGSADWVLEDTAYALSERRRLSGVLQSDLYGWGVAAFLSDHIYAEAANKSIPDRLRAVQNIVRTRQQLRRARLYSGSVLSPQRAEADAEMFERMASVLHAIMTASQQERASRAGFRLGAADLDTLEQRLGTDADRILVNVAGGDLTARDVIEEMRFHDFSFSRLEPEPFRDRLNAIIKDMVAAKLLAREGYRLRLNNTEAVRHDVSVWEDHWSASALIGEMQEEVHVTDEEVMTYLVEHAREFGRAYEVNIREVLADSLTTVLHALERANSGEAFDGVARELSRREAWRLRGGESGFFRVDSLPELGVAALWTDSGAYGGPLRLREGYSVFQVLDKRLARQDSVPPPDSIKDVSRRIVRAVRQQEVLRQAVGKLAQRTGVRIFEDRLKALQVNPSNMVTRRFIGFGGVITAVPSIYPLWQWESTEPADQVP
ncbi:MAG: hypothetical protein IT282_11645 [Bacteroidetes bacterium]|nr:hypothetical protein [Bacteroidota bacterium]